MWFLLLIVVAPVLAQLAYALLVYIVNPARYRKPTSIPYVAVFGTRGPPYDQGINNSDNFNWLKDNITPHVKKLCIFTPSDLPEFYTKNLPCGSTPDQQIVCHCNGGKHSYWRWKPKTILTMLETMQNGEVLMYMDCNVRKYPEKKCAVDTIPETCQKVLDLCGTDVGGMTTFLGTKNWSFVLGGNNDHHVTADRLVIRKSEWSMNFIKRWINMCNTDLVKPPAEDSIGMIGHLHDQAVLNVMITDMKKAGELHPEWPHTSVFPHGTFYPKSIIPGRVPSWMDAYIYGFGVWNHFWRSRCKYLVIPRYRHCKHYTPKSWADVVPYSRIWS